LKYLWILLFISFSAHATSITGLAYNNNKLVYTEKLEADFSISGLYKTIQAKYYDDADKEFAFVNSDFSQNNFVPDVDFQDARFNFKEKIKFDPKTKMIAVDRLKSGKTENYHLDTASNSVLGQGFNNFIVMNFDSLLASKGQINFIVTSRKAQYKFEVRLVKTEDDKVYFKIIPQSMLLKVFVNPILLTYDKKLKRLLTFEGISNIDDAKEKSQVVKIVYTYKD
jgi:hypothetical protein